MLMNNIVNCVYIELCIVHIQNFVKHRLSIVHLRINPIKREIDNYLLLWIFKFHRTFLSSLHSGTHYCDAFGEYDKLLGCCHSCILKVSTVGCRHWRIVSEYCVVIGSKYVGTLGDEQLMNNLTSCNLLWGHVLVIYVVCIEQGEIVKNRAKI